MAFWTNASSFTEGGDRYNIIVNVSEVQHLIWPAPSPGHSKGTYTGSLPNPRVEVVVAGNSQMTNTQNSTASCTYNKTFRFPSVFVDDFNQGIVEVRVVHAKAFFFQELIGLWNCTFESVYSKKDHCLIRTWLPLTVPERPTEPRGYIRLSLWVLQQGDQLVPESENLPSTIGVSPDGFDLEFEKYFLNVNIHIGQDLLHPDLLGGESHSEEMPNTSVRLTFLGLALETSVQPNSRCPVWNETLKVPARVPCIEDKVRLELIHERPNESELVGVESLSFQSLLKRKMKPTWINFYSNRISKKKAGPLSIFEYDEYGSATSGGIEYVGRILVSVDCHKHKEPIPQVTNCQAVAQPDVEDYILWTDVYEVFGLGGADNVKLQLSMGLWRVDLTPSYQMSDSYGFDEISGRLESCSFNLPSAEMCHDMIVRVYVSDSRNETVMCYASGRISATEMMRLGQKPKWFKLVTVADVKDDSDSATIASQNTIQMLATLRLKTFSEISKQSLTRPPRASYTLRQWNCRAYIFQAVNLPTLPQQLPDAYAVVQMGGGAVLTEVVSDTINPDWHQILLFEAALPEDLSFAQWLTVSVYHGDILLGSISLPPQYLVMMNKETPEWFELNCQQFPNSQARILCTFDLQPSLVAVHAPENPYVPVEPVDYSPQYNPVDVMISLLGVRFIPGSKRAANPFVQLEFGRDPQDPGQHVWVRQAPAVAGGDGMFNFLKRFDLKCHLPANPNFQSFVECRVCDQVPGAKGPVEMGIGYLHLNPFLPWVDFPTRKQLRRDFRLLPLKMRDMFLPGNSSVFLSPFYSKFANKNRLNISVKSKPASIADDSCSDAASTTAFDDAFETNSDAEEYYELSDDDFMTFNPNQKNFAADKEEDSEFTTLPNVYVANPDSFLSTSLPQIASKIGDSKLLHKKFAWIDTSTETFDEEDGQEELNHTMEQEVDLDDLPYIHVPIIDPEAAGCGSGGPDIIGYLKIAVRIYQPDDLNRYDGQLAVVEHHMSFPVHFKVRLHTISAQGLVPNFSAGAWDIAGISSSTSAEEPSWYLSVANGLPEGGKMHQISDDQNVASGYSPELYRSFELDAMLPCNAIQEITIVNLGSSGGGFLSFAGMQEKQTFGRTLIDIEDRIYHPQYADITNQGLNVPVELRALRQVGSATQVGTLKGFIEILSPEEAVRRPLRPLTMPRVETVQLRMVLWRIKEIPLNKGETVSLYVRALVTKEDGQTEIQETDTHWNSKDGAGVFNWRFVFDFSVPCQSPGVKLQVWNRNILTAHAVIAECFLDLSTDLAKTAKIQDSVKIPKMWYRLTHPSHPDKIEGAAELETEILTFAESQTSTAGLGREEPNVNPYLPDVTESREFFKASAIGQGWFSVQSKVHTVATFIFCLVCLFIFLSFFAVFKWFF